MVFQWLSWIFLASYVAGFEIDGIYPVSGGLGEVTIYGSNLNDLNDLRFRSETIQGMCYEDYRLTLRCRIWNSSWMRGPDQITVPVRFDPNFNWFGPLTEVNSDSIFK